MVDQTFGFEGKSSTFTGDGGGDALWCVFSEFALHVRTTVLPLTLPELRLSEIDLVGDSKLGGVGNGLGDAGKIDECPITTLSDLVNLCLWDGLEHGEVGK